MEDVSFETELKDLKKCSRWYWKSVTIGGNNMQGMKVGTRRPVSEALFGRNMWSIQNEL